MNEHELSFRDLAARLPDSTAADLPAADLWPRIAAAYQTRRRRRRFRRFSAIGAAAALALVVFSIPVWRPRTSPPDIDWQARAQALELQLDTIPLPPSGSPMANLAESELSNLDHRLQAAYDSGAPAHDVSALWQRRSELLDALLAVRHPQNPPATI